MNTEVEDSKENLRDLEKNIWEAEEIIATLKADVATLNGEVGDTSGRQADPGNPPGSKADPGHPPASGRSSGQDHGSMTTTCARINIDDARSGASGHGSDADRTGQKADHTTYNMGSLSSLFFATTLADAWWPSAQPWAMLLD